MKKLIKFVRKIAKRLIKVSVVYMKITFYFVVFKS